MADDKDLAQEVKQAVMGEVERAVVKYLIQNHPTTVALEERIRQLREEVTSLSICLHRDVYAAERGLRDRVLEIYDRLFPEYNPNKKE